MRYTRHCFDCGAILSEGQWAMCTECREDELREDAAAKAQEEERRDDE